MSSLDKIKAEALRSEIKAESCVCEAKAKPESPIQAMLSRLSLVMPKPKCECCEKDAKGKMGKTSKEEPKATVVIVKAAEPEDVKKPLEEKPEEQTEEKKHKTSPFVQRCVGAITGGKPTGRADESSAFAKCVSTQNKSHKDLDRSALKREGFKDRKSQFVRSLKAAKKHK